MAAATQSYSNDNDTLSPMHNYVYLEPYVQCHLTSLYGCLAGGLMLAAGGVYVHLLSNVGEWYVMCTAATVFFALAVALTHHTNENVTERIGAFNAFSFFSGVSSGPLIELAAKIDPSIISTAVSSSAAVNFSLSMAALSYCDKKWEDSIGVLLYSLFFLLVLVGYINTYIGSRIIFNVHIYSSVVLFVFLILYDTQMAVEKRLQGEGDFVWHSLILFMDMFHMFKLILIVLAQSVKKQQ